MKKTNGFIERYSKQMVLGVIAITILHTIYMNMMGFNSLSHDACVVYQSVPKWFFYLYENLLELFIVVILGIFAGVLMEKYFYKIKRFYPKNQLLAFLYASILPVCSCGVVPLIESMKLRTNLRTIITFVVAAPLLNPFIIFVSFTVLGPVYATLRIVFSFLLAIITGILIEWISKQFTYFQWGEYQGCATDCNIVPDRDPFVKTIKMTKNILPYILIAGVISFVFALINPRQYLEQMSFNREPWSILIMIAIGIPIYVCSGTDVIFLKPLLTYTDLSMGSAIAFSLASSAVCVSSIAMFAKFLGRNLTIALVSVLAILIFIFAIATNLIVGV